MVDFVKFYAGFKGISIKISGQKITSDGKNSI